MIYSPRNPEYILRSKRLGLRHWAQSDRCKFNQMNADELVMRYFPKPLNTIASNRFMDQIISHIDRFGYGLFAVDRLEPAEWIGFVGLQTISFVHDFPSAVEIGWRLLPTAWGHGYATEAAQTVLEVAKVKWDIESVVSFSSIHNHPSIAVMKRLGMCYLRQFDHPKLTPGNRLRRHVLYVTP